MSEPVIVIKSHNTKKTEYFDIDKLQKSLVATCRSLKTPDGQAEDIAKSVAAGAAKWAESKQEITTDDIRRIGAKLLTKYHPEAAYLYKQQLTVI